MVILIGLRGISHVILLIGPRNHGFLLYYPTPQPKSRWNNHNYISGWVLLEPLFSADSGTNFSCNRSRSFGLFWNFS